MLSNNRERQKNETAAIRNFLIKYLEWTTWRNGIADNDNTNDSNNNDNADDM